MPEFEDGTYRARVLGLNEFKDLRDGWNALVLKMALPSIFCTWEWIYTWWEVYGEDYEPVIIGVYGGGSLKGVLPLAAGRHGSKAGLIKGRALSYCSSRELYPDHIDIICAKEDSSACIRAASSLLSGETPGWDVMEMSAFSGSSALLAAMRGGDFAFEAEVKECSTAPYIELNGSFDDYLKRFDSKQRYNIKSRQKKLRDAHSSEYVACGDGELSEAMMTLFRLHELRAARKGITSTFAGPRLMRFHCALAERLKDSGWVWLRSLKAEGKTISALYCFSLGKHLFYYQIGIDPEWEKLAPGVVLIHEVIREACSSGFREFDFLRGNEEYKGFWTDARRPLFSARVFNRTVRADISKKLLQSKDILKKNIRKIIS